MIEIVLALLTVVMLFIVLHCVRTVQFGQQEIYTCLSGISKRLEQRHG